MRWMMMMLSTMLVVSGCTQGKTAPTCPPGQTLCGNACVWTSHDPDHCGACGKTCATGEVCSQGACTVACPAGFVDCGGRCVDPMSDPGHCGASADCQGQSAGTACTAGEVCSQGACAVSCEAGFLACGASCVDPATSTGFCGASADCTGASAGTACAEGQLCQAGRCVGNDASLSGLTLSAGTLSPGFDPGAQLYVATVGDAFPSVTVTPTAASPEATLTVNGTPVVSGTPSAPIPLAAGTETPVTVLVTAPGGATESYQLLLMRRGAHYLKASNTGAGDHFGYSVSVDGSTLVVGAPRESSHATGVNGDQTDNSASQAGAAYVFVRDTQGHWTQQAYLKASNTDAGDHFGYSVSLSGDTLVVGAWGESSAATGVDGDQTDNSASQSGAAYVFVRDAQGHWSQQAYLKASNTDPGDNFGWSVGVDGDTAVVGAPLESSDATGVNGNQADNSLEFAGAAYVFTRDATGTWSQQAYLKMSAIQMDTYFGASVSVSGSTVAVGEPEDNSAATGVNGDPSSNLSATYSGAAYVFTRDAQGHWSQQAYLKASNTNAGDQFGWSVGLDRDTLVVGAIDEESKATGVNGDQTDNTVPGSGAAYVFVRDASGTWAQQAYLKASNTGRDDNFGESVSIDRDTLVVGAYRESSHATGVDGDQGNNSAADAGAAYVFTRDASGTWSQASYLKASNTDAGDWFGIGVGLSGDTVVVGAGKESGQATGVDGDQTGNSAPAAGAAYVF